MSSLKKPQWKDCRVGSRGRGTISGLGEADILVGEGVKSLCDTYHQKLPVCALQVTIKAYLTDRRIIGRVDKKKKKKKIIIPVT